MVGSCPSSNRRHGSHHRNPPHSYPAPVVPRSWTSWSTLWLQWTWSRPLLRRSSLAISLDTSGQQRSWHQQPTNWAPILGVSTVSTADVAAGSQAGCVVVCEDRGARLNRQHGGCPCALQALRAPGCTCSSFLGPFWGAGCCWHHADANRNGWLHDHYGVMQKQQA